MANLRDLGLSEYEAKAYRTLLDMGPTTAKELSDASGVPMGRVYDVLDGLQQHRLVRSQSASRPKKYVAVEPEAGLDRLLQKRKQELEREAEQYEATVTKLSRELESGGHRDEQFWTAAVGREESLDLLLERLSTANESIRMVADTPAQPFELGEVGDRVMDEVVAALDRGVTVSILASRDLLRDVPDAISQRFAEDLLSHPEFNARRTGPVSGTFNVIDESEVCLEVPNPLEPDEPFAMIDLADRAFATDVQAAFDEQWTEAEPLDLQTV